LQKGEKFLLAETARARSKQLAALPLTVVEVRQAEDSAAVTATVEGLEPGLNYFFRLVTPVGGRSVTSEVVRIQAPVCPADEDRGR
jgi:hypothetical protein